MKRRSLDIFTAILVLSLFTACGFGDRAFEYHGTIDPAIQGHLKGKRIFIDPGKNTADVTPLTGPSGLREDEVNLNVAKVLRSIFTRAGAVVELSRSRDRETSKSEKEKKAIAFKPDLIIVIRHCPGIPPKKGKNHASVVIRGNREDDPQSFDLARILLDEFDKSFDEKGLVIGASDGSGDDGLFFTEKILCPEVAGRFGCIGDPDSESLLRDTGFNVAEAERYFTAISEYFKRGIPAASVMADGTIPTDGSTPSFASNAPKIALRIETGITKEGPAAGSIKVTLNGRTVGAKKIDDQTYGIEYGKTLMPGKHVISFSFRNGRFQSSPVYRAEFLIPMKDGVYEKSLAEGKRLVSVKKYAAGLDLLLPAFNSAPDDRDADSAVFSIARAFDATGDRKNAGKFYSILYNAYPQSPLRDKVPASYRNSAHVNDNFARDAKWIAWDVKR
ncbi:MAG TPA: N-acetylmuramoyl-L-alanine amidase [Spirochaetota bacterium]|nr:N-acetylmuramoyl-L-alanine amidase [Spirochaetota bacterium]